MISYLQRLIEHMRWADERIAASLAAQPTAPADAVRLFAHIAAAEHLWWARIQAHTPRVAVWPDLDVAAADAVARESGAHFALLLAYADDATLERAVRYRNSAGVEYQNTVGDIISHVAMHGGHHRGQILRELRRAGLEPPYVDFIGFARRD